MSDDEPKGITKLLLAQLATLTAKVEALGGAKPHSSKTLRELYELYDATLPAEERWPRSVRATVAPALVHFGDRLADELTKADWVHYRDQVRAKMTTIRKGPPTPLSLNLEMGRWSTVYRWGKEEGHVTTNPLAGIKRLRAKKHRETEPSDADVVSLRPHCDARLWAFVIVAFRSGMRASEVRRLEWRWIDLARGRIRIPAHITKTRRERSVRLTSDAVDALRALKPDIPGRYVFESERTGVPLVATTLWLGFRKAADAARLQAAEGDRQVVYHDLRHGFFSGATRRGVRLEVAMKLVGHTSLSTAQRYLHTNEDDLDEAQAQLEQSVRSGLQRAETEEVPAGQEKKR